MTFTNKQEKKSNYFLSQPHQPFFLLGVVNAVVMMIIFALNYKGVLNLHVDSITFHVYSLVFLVFTNVFTGFLFTTFPKFCQTDIIDKNYYTKLFFANLAGTTLFLIGAFVSAEIVVLSMLALFLSQRSTAIKLRDIYKSGKAVNKEDPYWILNALYFGLFSSMLFIISTTGVEIKSLAVNTSFYMYVIFLTYAVAQRMIPFFSHSLEEKNKNFIKTVFILFMLKTILASYNSVDSLKIVEIILDIFLGIYLLREFLRWKLTPLSSPAILWVLHLGLFWLPTAFVIDALALTAEIFLDTSFYFLGVHLVAIGFLTTILIGFGTRVTLGHSAQPPHADRFVTGLFWFIQVVVLLRALYSLNVAFGWGANFLFDISFTAWLVLFVLWSYRYAKVLVFGTRL